MYAYNLIRTYRVLKYILFRRKDEVIFFEVIELKSQPKFRSFKFISIYAFPREYIRIRKSYVRTSKIF